MKRNAWERLGDVIKILGDPDAHIAETLQTEPRRLYATCSYGSIVIEFEDYSGVVTQDRYSISGGAPQSFVLEYDENNAAIVPTELQEAVEAEAII